MPQHAKYFASKNVRECSLSAKFVKIIVCETCDAQNIPMTGEYSQWGRTTLDQAHPIPHLETISECETDNMRTKCGDIYTKRTGHVNSCKLYFKNFY